jgi:hypothetical protein
VGREIQCTCRWGEQTGAVKALLESDELIVRGVIRQRVRLADVKRMQADAEGLHFSAGHDRVTLLVGATEAERWLKKIKTPPPSLRSKLGLSHEAKALVVGQVNDSALKQALDGYTATTAATIVVAVTGEERQLKAAVQAAKRLAAGTAIWIVYEKGKNSVFGETRVREGMRALGYVDTKVASVSAALTASRFSPQRK